MADIPADFYRVGTVDHASRAAFLAQLATNPFTVDLRQRCGSGCILGMVSHAPDHELLILGGLAMRGGWPADEAVLPTLKPKWTAVARVTEDGRFQILAKTGGTVLAELAMP